MKKQFNIKLNKMKIKSILLTALATFGLTVVANAQNLNWAKNL
jgi:hypothetical protein